MIACFCSAATHPATSRRDRRAGGRHHDEAIEEGIVDRALQAVALARSVRAVSTAAHCAPFFLKCAVHERSDIGAGARTFCPSIVTVGLPRRIQRTSARTHLQAERASRSRSPPPRALSPVDLRVEPRALPVLAHGVDRHPVHAIVGQGPGGEADLARLGIAAARHDARPACGRSPPSNRDGSGAASAARSRASAACPLPPSPSPSCRPPASARRSRRCRRWSRCCERLIA